MSFLVSPVMHWPRLTAAASLNAANLPPSAHRCNAARSSFVTISIGGVIRAIWPNVGDWPNLKDHFKFPVSAITLSFARSLQCSAAGMEVCASVALGTESAKSV